MSVKVRLDEPQRQRVQVIIDRNGLARTAKAWNVHDASLLRAATGYSIQRGTRALIEQGLQKEGQP